MGLPWAGAPLPNDHRGVGRSGARRAGMGAGRLAKRSCHVSPHRHALLCHAQRSPRLAEQAGLAGRRHCLPADLAKAPGHTGPGRRPGPQDGATSDRDPDRPSVPGGVGSPDGGRARPDRAPRTHAGTRQPVGFPADHAVDSREAANVHVVAPEGPGRPFQGVRAVLRGCVPLLASAIQTVSRQRSGERAAPLHGRTPAGTPGSERPRDGTLGGALAGPCREGGRDGQQKGISCDTPTLWHRQPHALRDHASVAYDGSAADILVRAESNQGGRAEAPTLHLQAVAFALAGCGPGAPQRAPRPRGRSPCGVAGARGGGRAVGARFCGGGRW